MANYINLCLNSKLCKKKNVKGKPLIENKERFEFYQHNNFLKINNVKQGDEGFYTCIAKNLVATIESTARFVVNQPIKPYFKITQQNISVFEDHPITLECFAHGDPKVTK